MATELRSSFITFRYSTVSFADIATNGKTIVCEESSNISSTSNVTERPTKCATFTSTASPTVIVSGSGVAVGDLTATEASAIDLHKLNDAGTLIYFLYQNAVSGTLAVGEIMYAAGQGRFSNVTTTSDTGDGLTTFDWEFATSGAIDWLP